MSDLRPVGAFNSHQPGPLCDRFEPHTHMADGSIAITTVEQRMAAALLYWYDKTHGNCFGHDHHCPVRDDAPPSDRCTCGWSNVQRVEQKR